MRIRKKSWAEAELTQNSNIVNDPSEYKGKWKQYFGNDKPIYVEIGCGKGQFIVRNSLANNDVNFIGIERQSTIVAIAARKSREMAANVALLCDDAEGLSDIFESGEISRLYLNFSDPWPKKKWAKRRLTHRGFLNRYKEMFGGCGEIFFKTDNRGLFEFSLNEFCADGWLLKNISLDLHNSDIEGNIMTEYEERFSALGQPIYRLEAYYPHQLAKEGI